ncbi:hypothetical protein PPROV_000463000 [Pycnococcus provasolii]|uniref:Exostosin GT47 domain-containing protein n=1 Tax=Pycnococcus provasolii TaxID=41880 RepID=A0A830HH68_9CHLO|nr:hypothetical protein PPROV_000463000 [Pycnococcus provasolii]
MLFTRKLVVRTKSNPGAVGGGGRPRRTAWCASILLVVTTLVALNTVGVILRSAPERETTDQMNRRDAQMLTNSHSDELATTHRLTTNDDRVLSLQLKDQGKDTMHHVEGNGVTSRSDTQKQDKKEEHDDKNDEDDEDDDEDEDEDNDDDDDDDDEDKERLPNSPARTRQRKPRKTDPTVPLNQQDATVSANVLSFATKKKIGSEWWLVGDRDDTGAMVVQDDEQHINSSAFIIDVPPNDLKFEFDFDNHESSAAAINAVVSKYPDHYANFNMTQFMAPNTFVHAMDKYAEEDPFALLDFIASTRHLMHGIYRGNNAKGGWPDASQRMRAWMKKQSHHYGGRGRSSEFALAVELSDWVIAAQGKGAVSTNMERTNDPSYVWWQVSGSTLDPKVYERILQPLCTAVREGVVSNATERTLVLTGGDRSMRLWRHALYRILTFCPGVRLFTRVFFEAMPDVRWVQTSPTTAKALHPAMAVPLAQIPAYFAIKDPSRAIDAIRTSSIHKKDKLVLAAFGKMWKGTMRHQDRKDAAKAVNASSFMEFSDVPYLKWWDELKRHKFMLAPLGNGLQTPKVTEALLVQTIPIVRNCQAYRDLKAYGFPIVVVDSYAEVTESNLRRWWDELSVDLERRRWLWTTAGYWFLLDTVGRTKDFFLLRDQGKGSRL